MLQKLDIQVSIICEEEDIAPNGDDKEGCGQNVVGGW
jgi:hypothetical protein